MEKTAANEVSKDEKLMGTLAHILGLVAHFIAPLVIYLIKKDESEFVRLNAQEALNFQITVIICWMIAAMTSFILIGFLFFPIIIVLDIVFCIQGAMAANNGKVYRYPLSIRMIS